MEQHRIEIKTGRMLVSDRRRGYVPICSCGWHGQPRDTYAAAVDDGSAHHLAEIPDDAEGSQYA